MTDVDLLRRHNAWRRGDITHRMVDPRALGIAIDRVCDEHEGMTAEIEGLRAQNERLKTQLTAALEEAGRLYLENKNIHGQQKV